MFMSRHGIWCKLMRKLLITLSLLLSLPVYSVEEIPSQQHHIDFNDVPVIEFIRFVGKIAKANFIYDYRDLQFNVTFSSGKQANPDEVLQALIQVLRVHGFGVTKDNNYFVIHRQTRQEEQAKRNDLPIESLVAGPIPSKLSSESSNIDFSVYKLKYHQGSEIEAALKKIAGDLQSRRDRPHMLIEAIQTIQWVKTTNSLLYSCDAETAAALHKLIKSLDVALRQVFIEVLVVETDAKKTTEFGLQWIGGGKFKDKIGFGSGNFPSHGSHFASTVQKTAGQGASGLSQIPVGTGFDLGVIGDLIFHKGKSYLTLGSLVSALQMDGDSTIVLNQKIITQDNKNSKIFVGDTIPFTGSVVQTIGTGQQTTSNIEYRDIGVNLSITPMLGEDDIITLDINQEISEAVDDHQSYGREVEGIRTTKTNMATNVHVPDNHFLVISGMARNARSSQKSGLPCLGGLPMVGAAFSKNKRMNEKRNVIIFVRPHIINSFDDYVDLSEKQDNFTELNP